MNFDYIGESDLSYGKGVVFRKESGIVLLNGGGGFNCQERFQIDFVAFLSCESLLRVAT